MRKAILVIIATVFIGLAVATATKQHNQIKLKTIEVNTISSQLELLQNQSEKLQHDLKDNKTKHKQNVDELNKRLERLEQQKKELERKLSIKRQNILQDASERATGDNKVYATNGNADTSQVKQYIIDAANKYGLNPSYMLSIARCESNFSPTIVNYNYSDNGGHPAGLYQHISTYWPARAAKYGYAGASIFNAKAQANVTAQMFRDGLGYLWECK